MVTIQVKVEESEDAQFLHQCPSNSTTDDVIHSTTSIFNLQSTIQSLSLSIRTRILTPRFKESCTDVATVLDRIVSEAESYASKDQVKYGRALSDCILRDYVRRMEKEVEAAMSKGLIDGGVDVVQVNSDHRCHEDSKLWWAGKELVKGKKLSEYIGENEKTKIVVRLRPAFPNQQDNSKSA